jgi:hypothetical protein
LLKSDEANYFMVPSGQFDVDDLITVTVADMAAKVYVYGTIGESPMRTGRMKNSGPWNAQFTDERNEPGEHELVITTLSSVNSTRDSNLYIAVYCPPESVGSSYVVVLQTERAKIGIIPGLPDAASIAIFIVIACLVIGVCLGGLVFFLLRGRKRGPREPKQSKKNGGQNIAMNSMHSAQLSSDYPSANMNGSGQMLQPGYLDRSAPSQVMGGYDNTNMMNPYGGQAGFADQRVAQSSYPSTMGFTQVDPMTAAYMQQSQQTQQTHQMQSGYGLGSGGDFGGNGGDTDIVALW